MKRILLLALLGLISSTGTVLADQTTIYGDLNQGNLTGGNFNQRSFNNNAVWSGHCGGYYPVGVLQPVVVQPACAATCVRVVQPVVTCVRVEPVVQTVVVVRPCVTTTIVVAQPVDDSKDVVIVKSWASCGKYFTDQSGNRWKIFRGDPVVGVNRLTTLRGEEWRGSAGRQFFTTSYNGKTWTFTPE